MGEAEVRPVGQVRSDFAAFDPGSLTNRGLHLALAFNHDGRVQLGCKSSRSSSGYPPACMTYARTSAVGGGAAGGSSASNGGNSTSGGSPNATGGGSAIAGCQETAASTLTGASIHFNQPLDCSFTLAQAATGITIPYTLVIDQEIADVSPQAQSTCVQPGPSGFYVFEQLTGNSQSYCLCDNGFCSPPASETTTLHAGSYPGTFAWDGRNWYGQSDTMNPKGAYLPSGSYTLKVSTKGTQGGTAFEVSDSIVVSLTP